MENTITVEHHWSKSMILLLNIWGIKFSVKTEYDHDRYKFLFGVSRKQLLWVQDKWALTVGCFSDNLTKTKTKIRTKKMLSFRNRLTTKPYIIKVKMLMFQL